MGRVTWTQSAYRDFQDILTYIGHDSPQSALKVGERLIEAPHQLARHPLRGARVPEFNLNDLRELLVSPYRIIYEVRDDDCQILAIVHGSRDLRSLWHDRPA